MSYEWVLFSSADPDRGESGSNHGQIFLTQDFSYLTFFYIRINILRDSNKSMLIIWHQQK
jgi:hypothetical protein